MKISCGVLVLNERGELLLGHATGARHWDIPKGESEAAEAPRNAAARELMEETGLQVEPQSLHDLGSFAYRPDKHLHLFALFSPGLDPAQCRCTSVFFDTRGRERPELDAFEWVSFAQVPQRCAPSMARVLSACVSLQDVQQALSRVD